MKNKLLIFSILIVACGFISLSAQTKVVNNLCYDEEFTERISVVSGIDLSTLTVLDKLKFKKKVYVKKHREFINNTRSATHDMDFVSHENMFPDWYSHPTMIRSDETGTKSYFNTENRYMADGWTGGMKSRTEHGEYIEDSRTGERYLNQPYSREANEVYQSWNQRVKKEGFLTKYTFDYPSALEFDELQKQGFEVTSSENIIQAKNSSIILVWDIVEKVFIKQYIDSNTVIKTIRTYYEFNKEFETYLIQSIVTTTPLIFENGGCYETKSSRVYSNYTNCMKGNVSFKSNNTGNVIVAYKHLEVFPNPASDQVNISIPSSELKTKLQMSNVYGEILIERQIEENVNSFNIKVDDFPAGIYIIKCLQGKDNYSSKFIKQ